MVKNTKRGFGIRLLEGKRGRLYLKFLATAALIAVLLYSLSALASNPSAIPGIAADNFTLSPENVSIPVFTDTNIFSFANFTSQNGTQEANSTFKWFINDTNASAPHGLSHELVPLIYKDAVGYWHFDGNAVDATPFNNDGTVTGATAVDGGLIGKSYDFDGANDNINLGNPAEMNFDQQNFSISVWFRAESLPNVQNAIVTKWAGTDRQLALSVRDNGMVHFETGDGSSDGGVQGNTSVNTFEWHHVVAVYEDAASPTTRIYLDGRLDDQSFGGINVRIGPSTNDWRVGERTDGNNDFDGQIDEVAIYNKTLTASEVRQLYLRTWYDFSPQVFLLHPEPADQLSNGTQNTTLLLHFDDGLGSSEVTDSSAYGISEINVSGAFLTNDSVSGTAMSFDDDDDWVNVSRATGLDLPNGTAMWWFKLKADPSGFERMVASNLGGNNVGDWFLDIQEANDNRIRFSLSDGTNSCVLLSASAPSVGVWHHIAVTWGGDQKMFVDGALSNETISSPCNTGMELANTPLLIGHDSDGDESFNGLIDELKIVNRSLTAAEIAADYRKGAKGLFSTSDAELPTVDPYSQGVRLQPGRFVENLSVDANTSLYMRFDLDGSPVAGSTPDISGQGNNGSVQGAIFVNDSAGGLALNFTQGDFVNVSFDESFNASNEVTLAAWVKSSVPSDGRAVSRIISKKDSYALQWDSSSDTFQATIAVSIGGTFKGVVNPTSLEAGRWYHFAGTYDGTALSVYVDGTLANSTAFSGAIDSPVEFLSIGSQPDNNGIRQFNGTIDEVFVSNRSLTADEIRSMYKAGATGLGLLSNDYINYSATNNFNEREGTIEFWVKPEWDGSDGEVANRRLVQSSGGNNFLILYINGDLRLFITDVDEAVDYSISDWLKGDWHHVAVTWNNYTSNRTVHVDGTQVNHSGSAFTIPSFSTLQLGSSNIETQFANATISEFRISRKALTAQEINESFSKARQFFPNEVFLNASNTQKHESFKLGYRAGDAYELQDEVNSSFLSVNNSQPSEPTVTDFGKLTNGLGSVVLAENLASSATGGNASVITDINITWRASADNDTDSITYRVLMNGSFICQTSELSCNVTIVEGFHVFNVTAFDGEMNSTTTSYALRFDNATPTITEVAYTIANNSFQNITYAIINFSVTESHVERFSVNLTSTADTGSGAFNSFNGMNTTIWDKDLIGMWHFEDGSGSTTANDSSGFGNDGTLTNMNFTGNATSGWNLSGRLGTGLLFDGTDDYVDIDSIRGDLSSTTAGTWSAWVRPNHADPAVPQDIITFGDTDANTYILFRMQPSGNLTLRIQSSGTTQLNLDTDTAAFTDDTWTHVAVVQDGAEPALYVDGAKPAQTFTVSTDKTAWFADLSGLDNGFVGILDQNNDGKTNHWNGTIDEVKIWRRPLSAAEISAEFNRTASNYLTSHSVSGNTHTFTLNMTNLSSGNYTWFAWVNDSASNVDNTQGTPRLLTVDTIAPSISYVANTPANDSFISATHYFINTTASSGDDHNDFSAFIDFNNSLAAYFRFEASDINATNRSVVDFTGRHSGNITGFACLSVDCNVTGLSTRDSGPTSAGRRGGAFTFDGLNDRINVTDSDELDIGTSNFTIEWWMLQKNGTSSGKLFNKNKAFNHNSVGYEATIGGDVLFTVNKGSGDAASRIIVGAPEILGHWAYYAVTGDRQGNITMYRNGQRVQPANGDISEDLSVWEGIDISTSDPLLIGGRVGEIAFNGSIDEWKLWKRVLNITEINASYNAGLYRLQNNFTGLSDGNYTYRSYVVDAAGNINSTEERSFVVDTSDPTITIVPRSRANDSFINETHAFVNFTTSESSEHSAFVDFNNSLVGYWRFEDEGSINVSDFTSNNYNGSLQGFGCTGVDCNLTGSATGAASGFVSAGKRGRALSFDGVDDFVNLSAHASTLNSLPEATLMMWLNVDNGSSIFSITDKDASTDNFRIVAGDATGTSTKELLTVITRIDNTDNWWAYENTDQSGVFDGDWHHVAFTFDGTAGEIYLDGVSRTVTAISGSNTGDWAGVSNADSMLFGAQIAGAGVAIHTNGSLDDIQIWDRALTAAEINASFNAGSYRLERNFTGLSDGNYTWQGHVVDSSGQLASTGVQSFRVDTVAPAIDFVANTPANESFLAADGYFINTTATEGGNANHNDFSAFIDFNNSLVGWWRFEEGNGRNASDFTSNANHGNLTTSGCLELDCNLSGGSGNTGAGWTSSGRRGKGILADRNLSFVNVSHDDSLNFGTDNFSVELWFRTSINDTMTLLSKGLPENSGTPGYRIRMLSDNYFLGRAVECTLNDNSGVGPRATAIADYADDRWHHVACVFERSTNSSIYVDGVLRNMTSIASEGSVDTNDHLGIGVTINRRESPFNGTIDEVRIWSRVLSAEEVNASYTAGSYKLERNFTGLSDGNYSYKAYVVDAAGSVNSSENRTFVIDTVTPTIDYVDNTEANGSFVARSWVIVNVTVSDTYVHNVSIVLWNSTHRNYTNSSNQFVQNFSGLADGSYQFNATAYDRPLNINTTVSRNVTVDTTAPTIAFGLNSDGNDSTVSKNWVFLNFSFTELNNHTLMIRNLSSNFTNVNASTSTFSITSKSGHFFYNFTSLNDETYSFFGWINDSAANAAQTLNRTITVDTSDPVISVTAHSLANNSFINVTNALLNFSTTEASDHSVFVDFNNSLVGYWRFEDEGDTNASDFTSNNNNGTLSGFGCVAVDCNLSGGPAGVASGFVSAGKRGRAMAFDGVDDFVNVSDSSSFGVADNLTLEAWIYPNVAPDDGVRFAVVGKATTGTIDYLLFVNSSHVGFNSTAQGVSDVSSTLGVGVWSYLAVTFDGSDVRFYVDGVLEGVVGQSAALSSSSGHLSVGRLGGSDVGYFNGSIDEVRIWSRALSAQEVNASYAAGTYRYTRNFTGLSEGNYTFTPHVVDSAGTLVSAALHNFTVDTFAPSLSFDATTNGENAILKSFAVNVTANDTGNDHNEVSAHVDVNRSLALWLRFEHPEINTSNSSVKDASGYGNDGFFTNFGCLGLDCDSESGRVSEGKRGNAVVFDGSNDHIEVSDSDSLDIGLSNFTVELWVNLDDNSTSTSPVVKNVSWNANTRGYEMLLGAGTGIGRGTVFVIANGTAGADGRQFAAAPAPAEDVWTHIAVVGNRQGNISIYMDGELAETDINPVDISIFNSTDISNTRELRIGARGGENNVNGTIDEVKIWLRVLSREEINASHSTGRYRLERVFNGTDLRDGNYTFNTTVYDAAGSANSTSRNAVIDNTAPTIDAMRLSSNATGSLWVGSNSSTAATVYFNSIQDGGSEIGGGGQQATAEVVYSDLYRNSVDSNTSFSDDPRNDSKSHPQTISWTIDTGSSNSSVLLRANDTANNTDTATIDFILDINDTITGDNSSTDERFWYTGNVTVNITANDSLSGVNRTYYCVYDVGDYPCIPTEEQFTYANVNIGHLLNVNCSSLGSCQLAVRYYSFDNVSNNESGGQNGGSIKESYKIQIATGDIDVTDTTANGSDFFGNTGTAVITGSNVTNSTVDSCRVTNSHVVRSTIIENTSLPTNCTVTHSQILDTNVTSSDISNSFIDPSFVYDSTVRNSNLTNATVYYSRIENSTTCAPNFAFFEAVARNDTLISGLITFNGTSYFGPYAFSNICNNLPASSIGSLAVNQTAFSDNGSILFTYTSPDVGMSVSINSSELAVFDNTSLHTIYLNDNGTYPDNVASDAVYKANYTVGENNNVSDRTYEIFANVSDNLGNRWRVPVNVTIDNTPPNASIVINNGTAQTTETSVSLRYVINDTYGVADCSFANDDRVFTAFEACGSGTSLKAWSLLQQNGTRTVVIQVRDAAGNINETNDTIDLLIAEPTVITTPVSNDIIKGLKTIDVAAPSDAVNLSFQVLNASDDSIVWDLNGVSGAITFDADLSNGFSQTWRTTNFSNETKLNLTVISYAANGDEISRDTEGDIEVDNLPPTPTLLFPSGGAANKVVTVAANSSNDTAKAVFEYSNDGLNWVTLGTDFSNAGGWNITFDTAQYADTTSGRVRVNVTDDAGHTASHTGSNFEIDNTPPSITITAPAAGSTVSGSVNITYTIIGTVHGVQISFDGGAYADADHSTYHLWDTTSYVDGSHTFRIRANDSLNNTGFSETQLNVVDNGGANVIILSPESGGFKSGNVTITVSAPGTTVNVTFNVSNSSGYFNLSATPNGVTTDNTSAAWEQIWHTTRFAEDSTYDIEVAAYDASNALLGTDTITGIEVDNQIPRNATNFTIHDTPVDNDGTLTLIWNASTSADIDHYNVHRSQTANFTTGTGTFVKSVTTTDTTDTISTEGVWYYKVVTVDNVGRESNASNEVNVTIDLAGPTGTLGINKSIARSNDTIRFTFTGSQTGLTATVNATELQQLDSLQLDDFESNWTNSSDAIAVSLNSTAQEGSFSNRINISADSQGGNITLDLGSGNELNLSPYSVLTLWVRANDTGSFLNFSFGEAGYHENLNFTINTTNANLWEHRAYPLGWIANRSNSTDEARYLMFNVTTSKAVTIFIDDIRVANSITLRDDGVGEDATADDAVYTAQYNITGSNNATEGLKTVRALIDDGANFLAPSATTTLDKTPPFNNITINEGDAFTTSTTVVLTLSFSDANGVAECRYSNSPTFTSQFEGCAETKSWSLTASSGEKTVYYQVKDNAGHLNTSSDTITLDLDVPEINITSPVWGTRVNGTLNITFIGVESDNPKVSVDGGNLTFTTAVNYHLLNTTNLTEGEHTVVIRDEDAAGNVGESTPLLIIVDNIPALVTFVTPTSGSLLTGSVPVVVTLTEDAGNVSFFLENGTHSHPVFNDTSQADGWNFTLDTSLFADGLYHLNATAQYEVGGALSQGLVTGLEIDNTAPTPTLVTPADSATYAGTIILNATAPSDTDRVFFEYSPNSGATWVAIGTDFSNISGWTIGWDTTEVADGNYIAKATATDNAGLEANDTNAAEFTISNPGGISIITPPPSVRFLSGDAVVEAVSSAGTSYVLFNISNSTGANFTVAGAEGITNDTDASDGWRQTIQTTAFADGDYNITVYAYDTAGSLIDSDNRSIEFDNLALVAPILTDLPAFDIDGIVVLNWSDVGGDVNYYNLYRSTTKGFNISSGSLVKNLSGNSTTDQPVVGARYYYLVTAVDNVGHESGQSNEVNTSIQVAGETVLAGVLSVNDTYIADGDTILLLFTASSTGLNVTVNRTELARIDNSTITNLALNDSGLNNDLVSDDAVYTGVYAVSGDNNASDGNYIISGVVNDSADNRFHPRVNITLDNTPPNASVSINGGDTFAPSRTASLSVSFNDTLSGIQDCRLANEERVFGEWQECASSTVWQLSAGDAVKTVVVQIRDRSGNVNETNDTITLETTAATTIVQPANNSILRGSQNVVVIAPDAAATVTLRVSNATGNFNLNGSSGEFNDTSPEDGFTGVWNTTNFLNERYNLTAISYDANNVHLSNITFDYRIDNAAVGAPFGTLNANDTVVNDGGSILFTFSGNSLDLNVTINASQLQQLYNASGSMQLNDSGSNADIASDDAVYSGAFLIPTDNNASDGEKRILATVSSPEGIIFNAPVNVTLDNLVPNASISIFGTSVAGFTNVSTEHTVSRSVTLVTSFNDSVGVAQCRIANEDRSFSPWEACSENRAWLLSEGAGNKTVAIEVIDEAGNTVESNDTIVFNATGAGLDATPPLTPSVVDDGTYTNTDVALHAAWNTTDPESELLNELLSYEYRIRFNGTAVTGTSAGGYLNSTFTSVGTASEVTVHGLNLTDGNNYTFEVRAVNTAGLRSSTGESDGIIVDVSAPTLPAVNSTHLEGNWSSNNVVRFNWSAYDSISNVSAYSYTLDRNSTTIPDSIPEAETDHSALTTSYNDGQSSVLKFNSTGNAATVYVEVRQNASVGDVLRVTVQLAESHFETADQMGFRVYATNLVPTGFNMTANNISEIVDLEREVAHVDDVRDATSYAADITVNTAPENRFFVAVAGSTGDEDNNYNLLLAQSNVSFDSTTQAYHCPEAGSCSNTTNTTGYAVRVEQRDLRSDDIWDRTYTVGDGRFYFHVRAQDRAGNFGPTLHYNVLVDRSQPSTPQMTTDTKKTFNTSQVTFNWTESTDPESGVNNYTLAVDNDSSFSSPEFYEWVGNKTNHTVTGLTADTTYHARVHSQNQGGINSSWSDSITATIDTTPPVIQSKKPTGTVVTNDITVVLRTNEKAVCSGVEDTTDYVTFTFTNSTLHETRVTLSSGDGTKTFNIKCADAANNERTLTGDDALSITVNTGLTADSVTLQSPSVFTGEIVSTNVTVKSGSTLLGEIDKGAFSLTIGGESPPFSVFDAGEGEYTLGFAAPDTNGTYDYTVKVGSGETTGTLVVNNLLLVVQYVDTSVSANTATKLIYSVSGNFSIGVASDSRSVTTSSTSDALNLSANAKDGDVFVFMTRSSGNIERVEGLLKERKFLEAVNPSFGYQIDAETFVVFTDLEYSSISLSGNKTLEAGKHSLVIENKGYDTSLNKTKLEVRVK